VKGIGSDAARWYGSCYEFYDEIAKRAFARNKNYALT
jgi:hypothetical protein